MGATAPPPRPGSLAAGERAGRTERSTEHGARSTEQPRPRLLELRCCGTEPGACRWRGRRGRRPELESCPARAARPAAGSGGPERVSVSVTEGGGDELCRRPLKAGPGAERPPAGTRLPRACPRPGDPPTRRRRRGSVLPTAPRLPRRRERDRGGNGDTAGLPGDFPGPDSPGSGPWRQGRPAWSFAKPSFPSPLHPQNKRLGSR